MKTSDLIIIQQPKNQEKLNALKSFLKALKIDFEITSDNQVPIKHQNLVLERIKNTNTEDLLDWETVKDDFDGI